MHKALVGGLLLAAIAAVGGCPIDGTPAGLTTVRLVNNGTATLNLTLFSSSNASASANQLESSGSQQTFSIAQNSSESFTLACNALQSLYISNAQADFFAGVGPSRDSDVFRSGTDFTCGDTFTLTFEYTLVPVQMTITPSTTSP